MARRALIVGLGIAGMASAISLKQHGWQPIIIEKAPSRRTGGYFIGLQQIGRDAAEKLGIMQDIHVRTPERSQNWHMTRDGSRVRVAGFADQAAKPATLLRGDIEDGLWQSVQNEIEVRFDTTPVTINDMGDDVLVRLRNGDGEELEERFDLVVGADGLRSTVRKLVFGPHEKFMHPLNAIICAYQLRDEIDTFRARDGIIMNEGQRSLWVFPLQDHTPTALFTYRTDNVDAQFEKPAVETLRKVYAGMDGSGIVDEALADLETSDDYLFDSVHEVRMPDWTKNRVVLIGDSAWCLTLYSGMGATMAIIGGQQLGGALAGGSDDVAAALKKWQADLKPKIKKQRRMVWLKSQLFVPSNRFFYVLRRAVLRLGGRHLAKLSQQHGPVSP